MCGIWPINKHKRFKKWKYIYSSNFFHPVSWMLSTQARCRVKKQGKHQKLTAMAWEFVFWHKHSRHGLCTAVTTTQTNSNNVRTCCTSKQDPRSMFNRDNNRELIAMPTENGWCQQDHRGSRLLVTTKQWWQKRDNCWKCGEFKRTS